MRQFPNDERTGHSSSPSDGEGPVPGSKQTSSGGIAVRIARAASAQGLNQLARVVQLFLLVPICLTAWGTGAYEDWLLLNSIAAFVLLGDLGFVQFTTVKLIEAWSRGEQERFSLEWTRALGLFAVISLVLFCALGVLLAWPGWTGLIHTRALPQTEVASIAVLLGLGLVALMLMSLELGLYRARGDLSRSYHVSSIFVGLQTAGVAGPAALGAGPLTAALGLCIVNWTTLAAIVVDLRYRYPDVRWKPVFLTFAELSSGLFDAIGYLVSPAAATVMLNGPNVILANLGAPQGVIALFTASRTIAGVARQLPYQFAHPAGVELAGLLARDDRQRLSQVYTSASRALAIVVGVLAGFMVVAAPLMMTLWTRGKIVYDAELMFLLVGTTTICAPAQVAYMLLWYGGYPGTLNRALIVSTGLAMGFAILLEPPLGVHGVAIGLGAGEIMGIAVYLSLLVDRLLKRRAGAGLLRNFWTAVLSFLLSAAAGYAFHRLIEPRGWGGLIELGFAWSLPAAAGLYLLLLSGPQRARLTGAALSVIRSRKLKSQASQ